MIEFCDKNCNECHIVGHSNSRQISLVLNTLRKIYGEGVAQITNEICPKLTCCADCHVDDFTHYEDCEIEEVACNIADKWIKSNRDE